MEEDFEDALEAEEETRSVQYISPAGSTEPSRCGDDTGNAQPGWWGVATRISELEGELATCKAQLEQRAQQEAALEVATLELKAELARRERTIEDAALLVLQERERADTLESLADERAEEFLAERRELLAERDDLLFERGALLSQREAFFEEFASLDSQLKDSRTELGAVVVERDTARGGRDAAQLDSEEEATRAVQIQVEREAEVAAALAEREEAEEVVSALEARVVAAEDRSMAEELAAERRRGEEIVWSSAHSHASHGTPEPSSRRLSGPPGSPVLATHLHRRTSDASGPMTSESAAGGGGTRTSVIKAAFRRAHSTEKGRTGACCSSPFDTQVFRAKYFDGGGGAAEPVAKRVERSAVETLVRAMGHARTPVDAVHRCCWRLVTLANQGEVETIREVRGLEAVVALMKSHRRDAKAMVLCLSLLTLLSSPTSAASDTATILDVMDQHPSDEGVQAEGCGALCHFAREHSEGADAVAGPRSVDTLLLALDIEQPLIDTRRAPTDASSTSSRSHSEPRSSSSHTEQPHWSSSHTEPPHSSSSHTDPHAASPERPHTEPHSASSHTDPHTTSPDRAHEPHASSSSRALPAETNGTSHSKNGASVDSSNGGERCAASPESNGSVCPPRNSAGVQEQACLALAAVATHPSAIQRMQESGAKARVTAIIETQNPAPSLEIAARTLLEALCHSSLSRGLCEDTERLHD